MTRKTVLLGFAIFTVTAILTFFLFRWMQLNDGLSVILALVAGFSLEYVYMRAARNNEG